MSSRIKNEFTCRTVRIFHETGIDYSCISYFPCDCRNGLVLYRLILLFFAMNQSPEAASQEVLNRAKTNIGPHILPEPPKGHQKEIRTPTIRQVCLRMPRMPTRNIDAPPADSFCRDVSDEVVSTVLEDATDKEKADYRDSVNASQTEYDKSLPSKFSTFKN